MQGVRVFAWKSETLEEDWWCTQQFPAASDGSVRSMIVLSGGRLLNLGNATDHPSGTQRFNHPLRVDDTEGRLAIISAIRAIWVRSAATVVSVLHFDGDQVAEDASTPPNDSLDPAVETASIPADASASGFGKEPLTAGRKAPWYGSGAACGLIIAALGVIAALAGYGEIGLAAAVLALAVSLAKDRSVVSNVPAATALVMAAVVVLVQVPAFTHWPNFGITSVARVSVAGLCFGAGLVVWLRRRALSPLKVSELPEVVALSPALFLAGVGLWMATRPVTLATNWFFVWGDNVMHARNLSAIGALGRLDYSVGGALGGWLSFVSLAVVSEPDKRGTTGGLLAVVATNAQMLWALYVLVSAATSLTAMALVRHFGGHRWVAALAGLGAGAVMYWPQFFVFTMAAGFQTTVVLTFLLAVSAYEVLVAKPNELRTVVICSAAVVLTVHNYPLGLPIAGVLWLGAMTRYREGRGWRVDRRDRAAILVIICSGLASAPALQKLVGLVGPDGVAVSQGAGGSVMRLPVEWVASGLLAAALCVLWSRGSRAAGCVGFAVLVAFLEPIGAWLLLDVPLQNYYPTKLLWHVAALGVPLVWAWFSLAGLWLIRRFGPRHAQLAVAAPVCVFAVTVVVGLGGVLPAAIGFLSHDNGRILNAATSPDAPRAQVAWRAGETKDEDWYIQRLVSTYSALRGLPPGLSIPVGLGEQCETLRAAAVPVVLTTASQTEVTRRFACAPGVVRVSVQNSIPR